MRYFVTAAALIALAGGTARASAQESTVRLSTDTVQKQFVIAVGPVDLPLPGHGHAMQMAGGEASEAETHGAHGPVFPPIGEVRIPFDAYVHGFSVAIEDADGHRVPAAVLHHLNLITSDARELFLPISRRLMAMGSETGAKSVPGDVVGVPVRAGERVVVAVMLHNPTGKAYRGVTTKIHLEYVDAATPPEYRVYPFQMDVAFPFGDKAVDLPPGHSAFSWEGSPAIAGRFLVISGHLHPYATKLQLSDVTTGDVLWTGGPILDDHGKLVGVTTDMFEDSLAIHVVPSHTYRVEAEYDNTTRDTLYNGGMGVIGGVFLPDDAAAWPAVDTTNQMYALDRMHYMRKIHGRHAAIMAAVARGEIEVPRR